LISAEHRVPGLTAVAGAGFDMNREGMGMADGPVAVITGAGRGIGRAIALRLAVEGYIVVGSARTSTDLDRLAEDIRLAGGIARTVVADATEHSGAKAPVRLALEELGRVDVLVNNIGGSVGSTRDPFSTTDDDFEGTLAFTLSSPWWTTAQALPVMRTQQFGRIVNIGSAAAKFGTGALPYVAAKHGLAGLTKALAVSGAPHGITANCVCPGWTDTSRIDWERKAAREGITAAEAKQSAENESLQRRILDPTEIADTVAFVVSPAGSGITGQIISVDGGFRV
jgi:NAD(P)-dependent dehydrogenase (short-subunit alcohol dehydrogenase family)